MAAPEVRIERLVVRVPGESPDHAARLGRRVAEELARAGLGSAAPATGRPGSARIRIAVPDGSDGAAVARAVVDALRRSLR